MKRAIRFSPVILFFGLVCLAIGIGGSEESAWAKKAKRPSELAIVHNNRGVTELYQGNPERALFEFQTAVELDPAYVEGQTNLGLAYKLLGQYEEAKKAFERAIALDRKYATAYNHLGTLYYTEGQYEKAIDLFETAVKKNKKFADGWLNLGLAYIALAKKQNGDVVVLRKSIEPLRKATAIDTSYSRAHHELAQVYERLGDYEKAIIRYKLALETDSNSAESWIRLGGLYYQKEELIQAKNCFIQALSLAPQSVPAHIQLGLVYVKEANYPLAMTELQTALGFSPTNEIAYFHLGYAHLSLGNDHREAGKLDLATAEYQAALSAYTQAFSLNPTFADAAYNAGYTESLLGNFDAAYTWYQSALAADPKHYRSALGLGLLEQDRGHGKNANAYLCGLLKNQQLGEQEKTLVKSVTDGNGGCR